MKTLKLLLVAVGFLCAAIAITAVRIFNVARMTAAPGNSAVDIVAIAGSPLYLISILAVLILAGWIVYRWVLAR